MDDKSIEILEFPRVREILAGYTSFSTSRQLALNIQPISDYGLVSALLRQSAEARSLLSLAPDFSVGGISDIRELVRMAARGKVLEPQNLVEIEQTLSSLRYLHSSLKRRANEVPLLWSIASGIVELKDIEKDIGGCLTPAAEVLDTATPRLSTLRQQLRQVREHLLERFDTIIKSPRMRRIIQEPIITERDGRFVIPVKIESRKDVKGIVHDVSNTGATVFMEPWSTVEMGNELRELVLEEKREVERILADLSSRIGVHEAEICRSIELTAEIDLALAKARYAGRARATEPMIIPYDSDGRAAPPGVLKLVGARHPLLGDKAVPLSVELGRDFSVLVITGPNTGGKTVTLKTMGLLSLMALAGLPVPAAPESCIPVFNGIFADIGDEQSIERTLSSFSWHMGNVVRIIERGATDSSLVLLDELGTSTDPAEGSALARSILLHFRTKGALTVATTHYTDLKAFAHATPGFRNASLDFDPVTLVPTYHLRIGTPGGSNALATASRLGVPEEIIARARDMLSRGAQELETLLADLSAEKTRAESLRRELQKEKGEAAQLGAELKRELEQLKAHERRIVEETRDQVSREAAELHRLIRDAESALRKERTKERTGEAKKSLAAVREQLKGEVWQARSGEKGEAPDESRIAAGDTVWLKNTEVQAVVLSILDETREVEVQAGAARMRLSVDSVEKMAPSAAKVEAVPSRKPVIRRAVASELDLRGRRADEVEPLLDSYLNDASLSDLGEVRIIHGVGTGTVRKIVRDFLAAHTLVKSFRSARREEGGDGATIVRL